MKTKIPLVALLLLMCLHAPSIGQSLRNAATVTYDRSAGDNAILVKLQSFSE